MEILLFAGGFLTGAILVAIIFTVLINKNKTTNETLLKQMELNFENMANKIFEQNSEKLSSTNKEKLEDFFSKFKEKIEDFEKQSSNAKTIISSNSTKTSNNSLKPE